jgi:hypothetical protein
MKKLDELSIMQIKNDPALQRLTRELPVGVAFLGSAAFCLVCPYAGVMGIAALALWGHKLADRSEAFVAKRFKRTSVA